MAKNEAKYVFKADTRDLKRGAKSAEDSLEDVEDQAEKTGREIDQAFSAGGTNRFGGLSGALGAAGRGIGVVASALGAISIGAVAGYKSFVEKTIELAKVSAETGIPIADLQALRSVLSYAGYDFTDVESFFDRVSEISVEALLGETGAVEMLGRLNLKVEDLIGEDGSLKGPLDLFYLFAGAIAAIEDPAKRSAAQTALFGEDADFVAGLLTAEGIQGDLNTLAEALDGVEDPADRAAIATDLFGDKGLALLKILNGDGGPETMGQLIKAIVDAQKEWQNPVTQKEIDDARRLKEEWEKFREDLDWIIQKALTPIVITVRRVIETVTSNEPGQQAPDTRPDGTPKSVPEQIADDVVDFVQGDAGSGGSFFGNVLGFAADAAKLLTNPAKLLTDSLPDTSPTTQAERDVIEGRFGRPGTAPPANRQRPTYFADGGIVTDPTLGVVGEAGPEAVIPLSQLGEYMNMVTHQV